MRRANSAQLPSSFRDPSGFLFQQDGVTYRQLNLIYSDGYDHLESSGLYQARVDYFSYPALYAHKMAAFRYVVLLSLRQ
jgi:hypothetical protein